MIIFCLISMCKNVIKKNLNGCLWVSLRYFKRDKSDKIHFDEHTHGHRIKLKRTNKSLGCSTDWRSEKTPATKGLVHGNHVAMCNKYYPAIISPIERIAHEFYVSFVIIAWYIGSMIGSFMAIHLHTINRNRSELVLVSLTFTPAQTPQPISFHTPRESINSSGTNEC